MSRVPIVKITMCIRIIPLGEWGFEGQQVNQRNEAALHQLENNLAYEEEIGSHRILFVLVFGSFGWFFELLD